MQSAAAGDLSANFHWLLREQLVAVARSEEPNFYWLLPREALQRAMMRVEKENPRQGRLIKEEEEEEEVGEGQAAAYSSGGTLKLA